MKNKLDIKTASPQKLEQKLLAAGHRSYRLQQILHNIWKKHVRDFSEMTDIPKVLRSFLQESYFLHSGTVQKKAVSKDGTVKLLIQFPQNAFVETVFLPSKQHNTLCISCQAGCRMACRFCATGSSGFERHLESGEILDQILLIENSLKQEVHNIVIMGMGEPMDNYDNVIHAIRIINAPYALGIGARRITLSTIGIPDGIKKLAHEKNLQVRLSVSLHAPNDQLRSRLVPLNKKYPVKDILKICRYYTQTARKYVTFEYLLIKGMNDSEVLARQLADKLQGWKARLNIIPYNPVSNCDFQRPDPKDILRFSSVLKKKGINVTVRKERGMDIAAACGQLKHQSIKD